ncbi:hypothetical protein [Archangium sp.]|uniref:hypothetical protein n=1 Tax=Archangium sp. TaxID=1872627 RepID=UPI002D55E18C|nr:hypothetical protein [Archangium sp.]HYO59558.1 hypothetical protein [Archangium sp.]
MRVAEVIVFDETDPQEFSRVDKIARDRALETFAGYPGFESMSVFEDRSTGTVYTFLVFATEHERLGAAKALEQISRVVALAAGAKGVRRFACPVSTRALKDN